MQPSPPQTEALSPQTYRPRANYPDPYYGRQQFHHPRTSLGATGHWIRMAGILSPLLIGELVKDPDKRWRWIRIASVATAAVSEALWTHRIHKDREERQEQLERCERSRS